MGRIPKKSFKLLGNTIIFLQVNHLKSINILLYYTIFST